MHNDEERWLAGMEALSPLPRILFQLRNFHDVDLGVMAQALATHRSSIALCLAQARTQLHARCALGAPEPMPPDERGLAVAALEQQLRHQYRQWTEQTLVESGYTGTIRWPELSEPIEADYEAAATPILATLLPILHQAVERSRRHGIATTDLWRHIVPWRPLLRNRLARVHREISHSGWRPFGQWLADRIAPDRCYPHGYATPSVRRRPLPDEEGYKAALDINLAPPCKAQSRMRERLDGLPPLTRDAWLLFIRHGRTVEEIAGRLGIGRRAARRRIERATHIVCDWRIPSLASRLSFGIRCRWARWQRQFAKVRAALRD